MKKIFRDFVFLSPLTAALIVFIGSVLFSGCYVLQQGTTMLGYLNNAVPVESLLDENASEEDHLFVQRIMDIRSFAAEELGLEKNDNYTRYVNIDRDYLANIVSASAKDSFTRHEWWFPVTGNVPYKGFFDIEGAREEAASLKEKDLDVWIRRVDAFSTLGWFSDPLYSYMRNYPAYRIADLLIHEQLHATVYLKDNSQFNEELAEFIGTEGSRLYIEKTFSRDSAEYSAMENQKKDNVVYVSFIREVIAELETLYTSSMSREEKLLKKEEIIGASKKRFEENYDNAFQSDNYRGFINLPVNNAYFELFRLYYAGDNYLEDLYNRSGKDLKKFINAAKTLTTDGDPKDQLKKALGLKEQE